MGFWHDLKQDYKGVFERDPAARNGLEIMLAYPGFHAIFLHRINHLLRMHVPVIPVFYPILGEVSYRNRDTPRSKNQP